MDYQTVIVEQKEGVGVITLNRPKVRNALNVQLQKELVAALKELDGDEAIRVILIKGAGPQAFSAGRDLSELVNRHVLEYRQLFEGIVEVMSTIAGMKKPVVAAVHGYALAGGCGLAAACDLVVASDDAVFGTPEINVGLFPMTIMATLSRCVGPKKCLELLFTGDSINAREAERIGLVNRVVPRAELEEAALDLARRLASKSPLVLQMGKRAFYTMADMEFNQAIHYLGEMIAMVASSQDASEGATAFLEKRPPRWTGR